MSTTASAQKPGTKNSAAGRAGDSIFSGLSLAAGILIFAVLAAVALFLLLQALPTFAAPADEITGGEGFFSYIWPLVLGTLIAAIIALLIATPIGILVACTSLTTRRPGSPSLSDT